MTAAAARKIEPHVEEPTSAYPARNREAIARRFADLLFLPGDQASPQEKGLADEILSRLYLSLETPARLKLAKRLANLNEPPQRLTRLMAIDELDIAQVFLKRNELFDEAELTTLIAMTGLHHHAMIARRSRLSCAVTDALMADDRPEITEILLVNRGAVFSPDLYARIVEMSRGNTLYQELLLARPDLPASLAHLMFWFVGPQLRRVILQRYSMERRLFVEAVSDLSLLGEDAPEDVHWAVHLSGIARPHIKLQAGDLAAVLEWLHAPAECRRLGQSLAEMLSVKLATLERAVADSSGEPVVVFLKAIGLSASQFRTIDPALLARAQDADHELLAALFESLSTDWADLVLRLWDHQPYESPALKLELAVS